MFVVVVAQPPMHEVVAMEPPPMAVGAGRQAGIRFKCRSTLAHLALDLRQAPKRIMHDLEPMIGSLGHPAAVAVHMMVAIRDRDVREGTMACLGRRSIAMHGLAAGETHNHRLE